MSIYNNEDWFTIQLKEWFEKNPISYEDLREGRNHIDNIPWNKDKKNMQVVWNKGLKLTEEHKQKIAASTSKSMKGVPKTENHKKKSGAASGKTRLGLKRKPYGKRNKQENI
jgi:hypothetical protein